MLDFNKIELSILNKTESEIKNILSKYDIKNIHIDIMDWYFVKNLSNISPFFLKNLNLWKYKLHLHFMVENAEIFFNYYKNFNNIESVSFHIESKFYKKWETNNFIEKLKKRNIKVWLAINPITWIDIFSKNWFNDNLDEFDFIQIMTVEPWKGWQKFIPHMEEKIKYIRWFYKKEIIIDWWVNDIIYKILEKIVDKFVIWNYLYK